VSTLPPGVLGTSKRIGFAGYCCAKVGQAASQAAHSSTSDE